MTMTPEAEGQSSAPILGRGGMALLLLSLLAAGWYLFGHDFFSSLRLPGIGLTVTQWTLLAAVLICARKKLRLRGNWQGMLLLALAVLLGASYALYDNGILRFLNLPVLAALSCQAVFSLTGQSAHPPLSGQGLWEGFRRFFISLFRHWNAPFIALGQRRRQSGGKGGALLIGLALAIPAVAIAVALLSSADAVFGGAVQERLLALADLDGTIILKLLFLFPLAMALFSLLFSSLQPERKLSDARGGNPPPIVFAVILLALSIVYALFGYVQIRYLFGGAESARMAGGYAEYARSGFFQLVLLSILTLALILPALALCRASKAVRSLCAVLSLLTLLIDFSAFMRMRLYISAYGLSLLRVLTLWAMAMIALALIAAVAKAIFAALRICPILAAAALATWVGLNLSNVDHIVACNQASRINRGEAGIEAFTSLPWSPDYLNAAESIQDTQIRERALRYVLSPSDGEKLLHPGAYEWSLDYLQLNQAEIH